LEWLGSTNTVDIPPQIGELDTGLEDLLKNWLLVCNPSKRRSLVASLSHPFLAHTDLRRNKTTPLRESEDLTQDEEHGLPPTAPRQHRVRSEDDSDLAFELFRGRLWKLNFNGDAKEPGQWLQRDMWITPTGSLCYFSLKQNKRLILIDAHHIHGAVISLFKGGAFPHAFQIETKPDHDDHEHHEKDVAIFGCGNVDDLNVWMKNLEQVRDDCMQTLRIDKNMADELRNFKREARNRRMHVKEDESCVFAPAFRSRLWKVKSDGDRTKREDWYERDMWIAKNGSLVYWSKKEEKQLVYYTACDVANAKLVKIPEDKSCLPHAFQVKLPSKDGVEFVPGEFAAESREMYDQWLEEFERRGAVSIEWQPELRRLRSTSLVR